MGKKKSLEGRNNNHIKTSGKGRDTNDDYWDSNFRLLITGKDIHGVCKVTLVDIVGSKN